MEGRTGSQPHQHWRSLSFKCKDCLSEALVVEIYAQGMDWNILYALQVNKTLTFQELATRAYDMEVTIAYYERRLNDNGPTTSSINKSSMLRVSQENDFSYSESNAPEMLHKLLKKRFMKLTGSKRREEIERDNDPKYCKYHRIISHIIEKCNIFKRQVLQLPKEGKII